MLTTILLILMFVVWYFTVTSVYKKTTYYKVTGKPYFGMRLNSGNYGEFLTYKNLKNYEEVGAKFLFNCYLPKENGETTEIGVIMIHTSGIYVFESKNYSGWIFGSEKSRTWTQTLPSGNKVHKEHFLNPIMQNKLHIKCLQNFIGIDVKIHSIIDFSERCELKKVEVESPNIYVIKRMYIGRTVSEIDKKSGSVLSREQVEQIYKQLYPLSQVSEQVKIEHIQNINKNLDEMRCPKCQGELVLREAKKGQNAGKKFYGCSNFPKCRYIQSIDE